MTWRIIAAAFSISIRQISVNGGYDVVNAGLHQMMGNYGRSPIDRCYNIDERPQQAPFALYELNDPTLLNLLKRNAARVHLILSTAGSTKPPKGSHVWDGTNKDSRALLRDLVAEFHDRMFNNSAHIGHNKFAEQTLLTEVLTVLRKMLPFVVLGFDADSVFMNETVRDYCQAAGIVFTRCRPYRKNDQAWVEQKNSIVVRRIVGYRRLEGAKAAAALAQLYATVRLYVNFFQPSFKLARKDRDGARVKKHYHSPATPVPASLHCAHFTEQTNRIEAGANRFDATPNLLRSPRISPTQQCKVKRPKSTRQLLTSFWSVYGWRGKPAKSVRRRDQRHEQNACGVAQTRY
jgi:hypothetical protein